MAAHSKEQRRFIIKRLAYHCPVPIIVADFTRKWSDTACNDTDVANCDPSKSVISPDEWIEFQRERLSANESEPALAVQNARLHALQWSHDYLVNSGRIIEAAKIVAQIADELDGTDKYPDGSDPKADTSITWKIVDPE